MRHIYIIQTDRLYLRQYREEDFEFLHAMFSDHETMAYYPAPFSPQQTRQWMERNRQRYEHDGYGLWAVCMRETGDLIGDCGLVKQEINGIVEVEVGYHINKMCWSMGYASEAAGACKQYGFDHIGLSRLISIIAPGNIASIRVAQKIGFTKEKEEFIFNRNHFIYSGTPINNKLPE